MTANVGDPLSLEGTTYVVDAVDTASKVGSSYTGAKANGQFVIIDVTLTNEKNQPATYKYPLWSVMGDFRMFFETVSGRRRW